MCLALIVFTDGRYIGSVLDRNGLRPSRFYVSKSNFMYMASEVGVANVGADEVVQKGRLKPGRLLLVDTKRGVFVKDQVIKEQIATLRPVANWIEEEVSSLCLAVLLYAARSLCCLVSFCVSMLSSPLRAGGSMFLGCPSVRVCIPKVY